MLLINNQLIIRSVQANDRSALANLIHFSRYVHNHLDWRKCLDRINEYPFLVGENKKGLIATLACPPDPPEVAWVRLFAVASPVGLETAWDSLWSKANEQLSEFKEIEYVVAMPLNRWFRELLERSNFRLVDHVVGLRWFGENLPVINRTNEIKIRKMNENDLPDIEEVDRAAFAPLWHNSIDCLSTGFQESVLATVLVSSGSIVGYQISTATSMGGHLARLAVLPQYQKRGFGSILLEYVLKEFGHRGVRSVSVNTQISNIASLTLYEKYGFHRTDEVYPVLQYFGQ